MAFIETLSDVERDLDEALKKLQRFEDDVSNEQAWERLLYSHPRHPLIFVRPVIALGSGLLCVGALGLFLLPFVDGALSADMKRDLPLDSIRALEAASGMPLPVSFGILAVCGLALYAMAGQVLLSIGRDAALLPHEFKAHEALAEEVRRLQAQRNSLARAEAAAAPKRLATPTPSTRVKAPGDDALVSFGSEPLVNFGDDGLVSFGNSPPPLPVIKRPPIASPSSESAAEPSYIAESNTPMPNPRGATPSPLVGGSGPSVDDDGFGKRTSTVFPVWGELREPWLAEAVRLATDLANDFPIQARLEFNAQAFLPFSLVLRRATPAMAVRAVSAYINFLASIPTPPRARIELESVAHVDRGFRRTVLTALEPHFGDHVNVVGEGEVLDIQFTRPDQRWHDYPELPTRSA